MIPALSHHQPWKGKAKSVQVEEECGELEAIFDEYDDASNVNFEPAVSLSNFPMKLQSYHISSMPQNHPPPPHFTVGQITNILDINRTRHKMKKNAVTGGNLSRKTSVRQNFFA